MVISTSEKERKRRWPSDKVELLFKRRARSDITYSERVQRRRQAPEDLGEASRLVQAAGEGFSSRGLVRLDADTEALLQERLKQRLVQLGIMKEISVPDVDENDDWVPIVVKGRPLSEIIIEERR